MLFHRLFAALNARTSHHFFNSLMSWSDGRTGGTYPQEKMDLLLKVVFERS
jgi:hypothetical protein